MLSPIEGQLAMRLTKELNESALPNAPVVRPASPPIDRGRGGLGRLRAVTAAMLRGLADRVEPRRVVAAREGTRC
jgi:hypothetical protein